MGEKIDVSNLLIIPPRSIVNEHGRGRDLFPESSILHWIDHFLGVGVQVYTQHDATESSSEGEGKVRVLHGSESKSGNRYIEDTLYRLQVQGIF